MKTEYNSVNVVMYRTEEKRVSKFLVDFMRPHGSNLRAQVFTLLHPFFKKDLVVRDASTVFDVRLCEKDENKNIVRMDYSLVFRFLDKGDRKHTMKMVQDMARIIETKTPLPSDYRKYNGFHRV